MAEGGMNKNSGPLWLKKTWDKKPRVGIYSFSGCAGCQLSILDLEDELLDLFNMVDVVSFRMAIRGPGGGEGGYDVDIAFVEGSITNEHQIEELREIRAGAGFLVALGSCACFGGVQASGNHVPIDERARVVYGDTELVYRHLPSKPLSEYVQVDLEIPGCPINKYEFLEALKYLSVGRTSVIRPVPVCWECRLRENRCIFKETGEICMGPVTQGGCGALCPTFGKPCDGCRGPVDQANIPSEVSLMEEYGLDAETIERKFRIYATEGKGFKLDWKRENNSASGGGGK